MKPCLFILIMVLAIMVGCTPKGDNDVVETRHGTSLQTITPSPVLSSVDSLLWRQPDSALACLLPYFDTCCRDAMIASPVTTDGDFIETHAIETHAMRLYNRHYAHLLLAELLYKNDYAQTNRTELLEAVGYFDSLVREAPPLKRGLGGLKTTQSPTQPDIIAFLSARAHYINGVGYYEHDSVVEACKEYLKAMELMEEHFEEKELEGKKAKFMALTHSHLTSLFTDMYLHKQTIYFCKESLKYYRKHNAEPWHIAWILSHIGSSYQVLGDYDSAYYYYNEGLKTLPDANCLTYRDISTLLANLSYENGACQEYSLNQLHNLLTQAESHQEYASRCLNIGEIYYHEQQFDSAWHYLKIVYDKTQNAGAKKQAAEWLVEIGETQGKNDEVSEFARFLVPFATKEENQNSATKSQIAELYNSYRLLQLQRHNEEKNPIKHPRVFIIGVLFIIMLAIIILHYNKRQKEDFVSQLEAERQSHKMQQAALAGRLKRSNAALKEQIQPKTTIVPSEISSQQTKAEGYLDEPVCRQILASCNDKSNPIKSTVPVSAYADIALSDIQKAELKDAALRHYGPLFGKLRQGYPELKEKDFLYCYLCLLGLDNTQIAVLSQKSISTIWDRENRLKKIFGSEDKVSVVLHGFMID